MTLSSASEPRRFRTLVWIVSLATVGLMFDGYDLVVYGTVVSTFLRDPNQIGPVDPALAGALGSNALLGVLVGALVAGSIGDIVGRRKMMLGAYAWFSLGMAATAFTHSSIMFGLFRFVTGLGVGVLLATTAALVSEFAPKGKKNLCNAITYSGVPLGSLAAAALAIVLVEHISWRGMFLIGALPLVTLLPLDFWMMPESVAWLASRGHIEEARRVAAKTGVEIPSAAGTELVEERGAAGYRGLFGDFLIPAILIGLPPVCCWCIHSIRGCPSLCCGRVSTPRAGADLEAAACCAPCDRRSCRHRHQRYPDADLRIRRQLLPDAGSRRRRRLVRGLRAPRRRRRAADWRSSYRVGAVDRHNLLCAGRPRPSRRCAHTPGAGQQKGSDSGPRHRPLSSNHAPAKRAKSIRREDNHAILSRRLCPGRPGHPCGGA